jgi:hypothetical protein
MHRTPSTVHVCLQLRPGLVQTVLTYLPVLVPLPTAKCAFAHGEHELKVQTLNEM